jgi:hypothetical protein
MANVSGRSVSQARFGLEGDFEGSFAAVHVSPDTMHRRHVAGYQSSSGNIVQMRVYRRNIPTQRTSAITKLFRGRSGRESGGRSVSRAAAEGCGAAGSDSLGYRAQSTVLPSQKAVLRAVADMAARRKGRPCFHSSAVRLRVSGGEMV